MDRHLEGWSREVLCSCGAEQQAREGTNLSPFCSSLLETLQEEKKNGGSFYATKFLAPAVAKRLQAAGLDQHLQEPELGIKPHQKGSFVFRFDGKKPTPR